MQPIPRTQLDPAISSAQQLFRAGPGFLDTASAGLPPQPSMAALAEAMQTWNAGQASPQHYDGAVQSARASFARLVGVSEDDVAVGSQASVFAGLVAAALPDGANVVMPEQEFTSVVFPLLAQQFRGVSVRFVPLERMVDAIDARTTLVALSSVASCDGRVADLAGVREAAGRVGAQVLLDATQSAGWLPLDAASYDYVICSAYKWLLCPRGVAFLAVRPHRLDGLVPLHAGWYAGEDPWSSIYGGPLRLAASARRFDVSPAWLAWVGAVPALELIERTGVDAVHTHNVALANAFRAGMGMAASDSAIVSVGGIPDAHARLAAAGIRASVRAGGLRAAFHLYNTDDDVEQALNVLR